MNSNPIPAVKLRQSLGDILFRNFTMVISLGIILLVVLLGWELYKNAGLSLEKFGWSFLWRQHWDPVMEEFGALPFIFGTLVSSLLALLMAVPLGLGVAVFLNELAPAWMSETVGFLTELLAAIPSVVYGLIGIFIFVPWMRTHFQPAVSDTLGFIPIFKGVPYGVGMFTAACVLAIMIVPFITTISREIFKTVQQHLKESALSLGATKWEVLWLVTIPFSRSGILGSIFLALGRALGETMAITMVIGNRPEISFGLFDPGYTMAAVLANEFTEAVSDLYISVLIHIGLSLFLITILVNGLARWLIYRTGESH